MEKFTPSSISSSGSLRHRSIPVSNIRHKVDIEFIALPLVEEFMQATWTKRDGDIVVSCPRCGRKTLIDQTVYTIKANGLIWPSVFCESATCDFDRYVLLQGYNSMGAFGRKKDNDRGVIFYAMVWMKPVKTSDGKEHYEIQPCEYTHAVDEQEARRTWQPLLNAERGKVIGIAPSIDPHVAGAADPSESILAIE